MDALASVGGVSSIAMWSVLMNWRSIVSSIPAIERIIDHVECNHKSILRSALGTWPGFLLAVFLSFVALAFYVPLLWRPVRIFCLKNWSTQCTIKADTDIFRCIRIWAIKSPRFHYVTDFEALSESPEDSGKDGIDFLDGEDSIEAISNNDADRLCFSPTLRKVNFWHNGAYFWFEYIEATKTNWYGGAVPDNTLIIHSFSWNRSNKPIQDLLGMIKNQQKIRTSNTIAVRAPDPDCIWRWGLSSQQYKRPLETVFLDRSQIDTMVHDIRSFLSRAGVQWHKDKGLPLRLGYLFSGPPGTGKSSLALALAGHFGLPIYILNLSTPKMTDAELNSLFTRLPFHCIILLEDIDATKPLTREDVTKASAEPKKMDTTSNDSNTGSVKTEKKNEVTLAGLLNVIDGVSAHQGRILIMTTNHIEVLDEALIRTGRADRIITFTNTTKDQAKNMFVSAYKGTRWIQQQRSQETEHWTDSDIVQLAKCFADRIPDEKLSPALLQQYFKDFRAQPRRAIQEVEEWTKDPRGYRKAVTEASLGDIDFGNGNIGSLVTRSTSQVQPSSDGSSLATEKVMKVPGGFPESLDGDKAESSVMLIDL